MDGFKLLVDTNVVIGLEDAQPVQASLAELVRLSSEHAVGLFVDGATYDDVARDKDEARRVVTLSKLAKFQRLRGVPVPDDAKLVARFGAINTENDRSDVRLLLALHTKAVDFLVTQDIGLHRRADRVGLAVSVLTVEEALQWLKQTFTAKSVSLPYVVERKAYQINQDDAILTSLRSDYPGFDRWFDKCRRQHRDCWLLEIANQIAGLVIRKDETHLEAGTQHPGPKILKICTFKVHDEFQGEKFGELLLKQVLWFAQRNKYDLTYVTAFPKQAFLIDLLSYYGFRETKKMQNGEIMLEKPIMTGNLPPVGANVLDFDREHYPRFHDAPLVRKFCVPIQPDYHRRLFPEIAFASDLPLFPREAFGPIIAYGQERTPGNTIRKVYLCRAKITRLRPGDILFFYMSKDDRYALSQSITTVGVVEQVVDVTTTDDLIRHTAKRSVFSAEDLDAMRATRNSPVKLIDFLLIGHIQPPMRLNTLVQMEVFSHRPPQSIAQFTEERYTRLKPHVQLAFDS
jgi:ribosomal protein S18 acetylase RimI-like enzyme